MGIDCLRSHGDLAAFVKIEWIQEVQLADDGCCSPDRHGCEDCVSNATVGHGGLQFDLVITTPCGTERKAGCRSACNFNCIYCTGSPCIAGYRCIGRDDGRKAVNATFNELAIRCDDRYLHSRFSQREGARNFPHATIVIVCSRGNDIRSRSGWNERETCPNAGRTKGLQVASYRPADGMRVCQAQVRDDRMHIDRLAELRRNGIRCDLNARIRIGDRNLHRLGRDRTRAIGNGQGN